MKYSYELFRRLNARIVNGRTVFSFACLFCYCVVFQKYNWDLMTWNVSLFWEKGLHNKQSICVLSRDIWPNKCMLETWCHKRKTWSKKSYSELYRAIRENSLDFILWILQLKYARTSDKIKYEAKYLFILFLL